MARLEAQSKLLYYPTPPHIVTNIATWFTKPDAGTCRLADPCCGDGAALANLTHALPGAASAETWGVEISYSRAAEAAKLLNVVLPTDFYPLRYPGRWSNASVGLMFNNPPYDWSENFEIKNGARRLRHEVAFIEGCTPKVQVGGHHVIIVPRAILGSSAMLGLTQENRIARHLLGWFEQVEVYRFDDPHYEIFKQVVIFALRKRTKYHASTDDACNAISCQADETYPIPALAPFGTDLPFQPDPHFIPPAEGNPKFSYAPTNSEDLVAAAQRANITASDEYIRATHVRPLGAAFHPAMPLCIGHVSMLITGQETGILSLTDPQSGPFLVKGMARKVATDEGKDHTDEEGRYSGTTVTQTERHEAAIAIIRHDGKPLMLTSPTEVGAFMTDFVGRITDSLLERNQPTYDLKPIPSEWAKTAQSALGLPALPGRTERGLFPTQRHFAIAATRTMRKHGSAVVCAEMGFGKTSTSVAALELMGKFPALVMCPGHMVWKWKRDLERSSDPTNPIVARVITRPAAVEPGNWPKIKAELEAKGCTILSTSYHQVDPVSPNDPAGRRTVTIAITPDLKSHVYNIFTRESFKDPDTSQIISPKYTFDPHVSTTVEYVERDDYTMFNFAADFAAGILGPKPVAVIAFDPAKYDAGSAGPAINHGIERNDETGEIVRFPICPTCAAEVVADSKGNLPRFCEACHHALFSFTRWQRIGLARLLQRKFRHFFKVYVADEVHKCQDGRTDIGAADQRLISATRYNLALTGTLFGGVAGSLFFLLYRRSPEVRRLYAFDEKIRWVDHYGLWEKTWDQKEPIVAGTGASTGITRWNYRQRELPGISPAVIRFLLPITLFGNITDLGYELPPIYEQVEQLAMPPALQGQYNEIEGKLLRQAIEAAKEKGDVGALSVWFNTARFRPASAFRDEVIAWEGKKGGTLSLDLPAVDTTNPLPKEHKLAEIVSANMRQNRKTLVFVEQTGTRDIRQRLEQILKIRTTGRSCKVGILSAADMKPARREAWIKTKAPELDVLIVNPKLVETGLDLIMFSDLVFYETTTSLYVLWQSMRRVWRLGQAKPVTCTFLAYSGTMEETILDRMGKKMKFAQLLYGKEAAGVLVETGGEDDIQRELIQAALAGKAFRNAGEMINLGGIFTNGSERTVQVSQAPTGSMVAASPVMPIAAAPLQQLTFFSDTGVVQLSLLPGFEGLTPPQPKKRRR